MSQSLLQPLSPLALPRYVYIKQVWGAYPVQAFGTVNDLPFYFRGMYNSWTFSVARTRKADPVLVAIGAEPGFHLERRYVNAGFMPHGQCKILIGHAAWHYRSGGK